DTARGGGAARARPPPPVRRGRRHRAGTGPPRRPSRDPPGDPTHGRPGSPPRPARPFATRVSHNRSSGSLNHHRGTILGRIADVGGVEVKTIELEGAGGLAL